MADISTLSLNQNIISSDVSTSSTTTKNISIYPVAQLNEIENNVSML